MKTGMQTFVVAVATGQRLETSQMSISRGMDKETVPYSYLMEYYSTIKMNKLLIYVNTDKSQIKKAPGRSQIPTRGFH